MLRGGCGVSMIRDLQVSFYGFTKPPLKQKTKKIKSPLKSSGLYVSKIDLVIVISVVWQPSGDQKRGVSA